MIFNFACDVHHVLNVCLIAANVFLRRLAARYSASIRRLMELRQAALLADRIAALQSTAARAATAAQKHDHKIVYAIVKSLAGVKPSLANAI